MSDSERQTQNGQSGASSEPRSAPGNAGSQSAQQAHSGVSGEVSNSSSRTNHGTGRVGSRTSHESRR